MRRAPTILLKKNLKKSYKPKKRDGIGWNSLYTVLQTNVVEIRFKRRIIQEEKTVGHMNLDRHMLCTSNYKFLTLNPYFKNTFKWEKPRNRRGKSYYMKHDMFITWDLMQGVWRIISRDKHIFGAVYPIQTGNEQAKFVEFYITRLKLLSKNKKLSFSDK